DVELKINKAVTNSDRILACFTPGF
ncbi:hypothetical protein D018_0486B, partial [Vibrio parahaemolyticus VP2007-007]